MIFLALSESSSSDVEEGPIDNTVGEAAGGEDVSFNLFWIMHPIT